MSKYRLPPTRPTLTDECLKLEVSKLHVRFCSFYHRPTHALPVKSLAANSLRLRR